MMSTGVLPPFNTVTEPAAWFIGNVVSLATGLLLTE